MSDGPAPDDGAFVEIRILQLGVEDFRHSSEHHDELLREFALIQSREPESQAVPVRLTALMGELTEQFSGFGAIPQSELDDAIARGDTTVDLVYLMPPEVGPACEHLMDLLHQADEYCRSGDLLTLAPPVDAVAFRDWFLLEFVRQCRHEAPVPWPEYVHPTT